MALNFTLRSDLSCILIDASYYVFYRYFDTWKYYKNTYAPSELHTIPSFVNRIYHEMDSDIAEMLRSWKSVVSNVIFCKDCSRRSIWRNEHSENYKSNRPKKTMFNPHMFSIVSQYCKDRRIQEMFLDKTEADDLIALTKRKLRDIGFTSPIIILTNDNDYLQLLDDNTHAYNMNYENNNLRERSAGSAKIDLRMKILMGDRSDNIPAVKHHLGPKKAMKLAKLSEEELYQYLSKHGCRDNYERNAQLIDFNCIRYDIQQLYFNTIEFYLRYPLYP
jgi:5'-3' exonuclease